jgi:hypothetical protein
MKPTQIAADDRRSDGVAAAVRVVLRNKGVEEKLVDRRHAGGAVSMCQDETIRNRRGDR